MIYEHITELIGNTPLLKISPEVHGLKNFEVYAKLEYMNPFGSVKDRVAKGMLEPLLPELKRDNKTVLEASSGNTAKALSILSSVNGLKFKTVTNRIKTPEIRMLLQVLGAEIEELPGLSDCPDPLDPNDFTTVACNLAKKHPELYHYTDQYFNKLNFLSHYNTTGKEIYDDLKIVDYYFGFLGTCGSSMGVGKYLKEHSAQDVQVYGVVAAAGHHVPGGRNMEELWEVGFFEKTFFKDIISGTSDEAVDGMLELNRKCGMMCGPTTGLTYYSLVQQLKELDDKQPEGKKQTVVFIACDRLESYMSYIQARRPELFTESTSHKAMVKDISDEEMLLAPEITPEELSVMAAEQPLILDTRSFFAFHIGHIPESINVLDEYFVQLIQEGPIFPKDKKIIVVCRIGNISRRMSAFLRRQGYDAYSLAGGMHAWKSEGQTVVNDAQRV